MKNWQVVAIDPNNESILEAFGVTETRAKEIHKFMFNKLLDGRNLAIVLEDVTGFCTNINEACLASMMIGTEISTLKTRNEFKSGDSLPDPIKDIISDFIKHMKKG